MTDFSFLVTDGKSRLIIMPTVVDKGMRVLFKPLADEPCSFFFNFLSQPIAFISPLHPWNPPLHPWSPSCCLSSLLPTAYLSGSPPLRRCRQTRCGFNELSAECRWDRRDKQDNFHTGKLGFNVSLLLPFLLYEELFFKGGFFWVVCWGVQQSFTGNRNSHLPPEAPPRHPSRRHLTSTRRQNKGSHWRSTPASKALL